MADLEFVADFTDLQLMRRELVGVAKDAKQSAGVFEREYNRVERQITRTAKASQKHYNELLKVDRASKSAANSADVFNRELGKQEANVERLKNKYLPLYAASKQYERAIEELNQAYVQGALTQGQYLAAMENIDAQLANNTTRAKGNTRSMNAVGMAVQQTGYQVGDFLVQIQSGTNAMVAFGQQATQLVGILPMMAEQFGMNATRLAFIATGLGIAIPLFTAVAAAIMRTREANKDAADSVKTLDDELKSLNTTLKDWVNTKKASQLGLTVEELLGTRGIEQAQEQLKDAQQALTEYQRQIQAGGLVGGGMLGAGEYFKSFLDEDAVSKYEAAVRKVIDAENTLATLRQKQGEEQFKNFSEQRREMEQQLELSQAILAFGKDSAQVKNLELQQEIENRKRAIDQQVEAKEITIAQGNAQKKLVEEMLRTAVAADESTDRAKDQAELLQEEVDILAQANQWRESNLQGIRSLNFEQNSLIGSADEYVKKVAESFQKSQDLREELGEAAYEALRLAGVDMASGVDAAAKAAATLAANLGISLRAAIAMQGMMSKEDLVMSQEVVKGPATDRFGIEDLLRMGYTKEYLTSIGKIKPSRGGGGGGRRGKNPIEQAEEYLQKIQREADFKRTLIGLSDEQVAQETRREQLLNQLNGYEEGLGNQYSERIEQIIQTEAETRKLIEAEQKREQMMRMIESNIESAFMSIVDGSKSVEDAFKSMLRNILLEIYRQQVAKPAASGISDLIGNFISGFKGSVSIGRGNSAPTSSLRPKARSFEGGGFTGYGPRSGGLDGRGGMLAMVHPNETVVDHTKGQKAGGNVTVVQNFSFQANGDESVKRIIGQSMPQIAQYTSKTIVDQRRKGGSMKAAFRG